MLNADDRFALQDLVNRYAYHIDLWQIDAWAGLFTPHGVLDETPAGMGIYSGREEITAYGGELKADVLHVVHLMMNHVILDSSEDRATGGVFALVEADTRSSGHVRHYIRYDDNYVRTADGWQFERRNIIPMFPPQVISAT